MTTVVRNKTITGGLSRRRLLGALGFPAGMASTGPRNRLKSVKRLASGNFWDGSQLNTHPPLSAPGSTWSAGGLLSTAVDMDLWPIALNNQNGWADPKSMSNGRLKLLVSRAL